MAAPEGGIPSLLVSWELLTCTKAPFRARPRACARTATARARSLNEQVSPTPLLGSSGPRPPREKSARVPRPVFAPRVHAPQPRPRRAPAHLLLGDAVEGVRGSFRRAIEAARNTIAACPTLPLVSRKAGEVPRVSFRRIPLPRPPTVTHTRFRFRFFQAVEVSGEYSARRLRLFGTQLLRILQFRSAPLRRTPPQTTSTRPRFVRTALYRGRVHSREAVVEGGRSRGWTGCAR